MGEHAAVYGRPALVAAVDPRARVEVGPAETGLEIELIDYSRSFRTGWQDVRRGAADARRAWERYFSAPTPESFAAIESGTPEKLVSVALGEVAMALGRRELPPLAVRVSAELPIGSGFGSSAAIAVALIGGVLTWLDGHADSELVDALALEVERRQHGLPSGVDHKTVLLGGVVLASRRADGGIVIGQLARRSPLLDGLQVYQTGEPAETTGEVVAAVRRRRDESPERFAEVLDRMTAAVEALRRLLESPRQGALQFAEQIRDYESCLEALGVVPASVRETIRQVEALGGAAKISGAGALTGSAAGCLLVHWPEGPPPVLPTELEHYSRQTVELGAQGFRVEEQA